MKLDEATRLLEQFLQTKDPSDLLRVFRQHNLIEEEGIEEGTILQPKVPAHLDNPTTAETIQISTSEVDPNIADDPNTLSEGIDDTLALLNDTIALQESELSKDLSLTNLLKFASSSISEDFNTPATLSNSNPPQNQSFGRYEKLGVLGKGGMGVVWKVKDHQLNRTLALKIIHQQSVKAEEHAQLIKEAQISAQLQHPGIIPVHEMGNLPNNSFYFTMKEIRGRTFKEIITRVHTASSDGIWRPAADGWNFRRLISVFHSICETIAYAHSRGVIHLDIKPANIMIGDYGEVLVVDWGIAQLIDNGSTEDAIQIIQESTNKEKEHSDIRGTPTYMAPEQALGLSEQIDQRSDIYALGSMLYQILSGRNAYLGRSLEIVQQKRSIDPPSVREAITKPHRIRPSAAQRPHRIRAVPEELADACDKAMQRKRDDRYQTVNELADIIQAWLEGSQRREKALEILDRTYAIEQDAEDTLHFSQEIWAQANELITPETPQNPSGWKLWNKSRLQVERVKQHEHEIEHLLQGALIYAPEMTEIYRKLIQFEYKLYIKAVKRTDHTLQERVSQKLASYLEMLPKEEQQQWETRRLSDVASINLLRRRQGHFIGRKAKLEQLLERLETARLISLLGTAGVGKTHLAVEASNQWRSLHNAEIVFCDVTAATDLLSIIQTVGEALSIKIHAKQPLQQIGENLAKRGNVLLILDNLEQVIKPSIEAISAWLEQSTQLKILVTSRIPLNCPEEQQIKVQPLSILEGFELFLLRAQKQLPKLQLSEENREIICAIIQRLDCLPLAIELAAARVSMLPLNDIYQRLKKNFDLLRGRLRDPEQQALQGALDWSWNLLKPWSQMALAQSSIFRNGFTLHAAESVLDLSVFPNTPNILDVIEALCDDNLVFKQQMEDGTYRYNLLVSIQAYAAEQLQHITQDHKTYPVAHRHARYYGELWTESKESGSTAQKYFKPTLELDNCIAGAEHGLLEDAKDCCLAAMEVLRMRGPMSLGIELTSSFLSRPNLPADIRLPIHLERANCLRINGQVRLSREETTIALELAEELESSSEESEE